MNTYILHNENSLMPIHEGTYRECQKHRTMLNKHNYWSEKPVFAITLKSTWETAWENESARMDAILDEEERQTEAYRNNTLR